MYYRLLIMSTPLFLIAFCVTWWIRGKGFGDLVGLVRPARPPADDAGPPQGPDPG